MNDPRSLEELQRLFPKLIARFTLWVYDQGWELTVGEAWRTPQQAAWDAAHGTGILHSLHIERLAEDFNLFVGGVWQTDAALFKPLADYWKTLDPLACAGYDWGDADHFSLAYGGRR